MGYSCTQKADLVLRQLMIQLQAASETDVLGSNEWTHHSYHYFYEIGRENDDGAITGTVFFCSPICSDRCNRGGSFRIEPEGKIARFPTTTRAMRWSAYQAGMGEYQRIHNIPFMVI